MSEVAVNEFNVAVVKRAEGTGLEHLDPSIVAWATDPEHLHRPGGSDVIIDEVRWLPESMLVEDTHLEIGVRILPGESRDERTLYIAGKVRKLLWEEGHAVNFNPNVRVVSDINELWRGAPTDTPL